MEETAILVKTLERPEALGRLLDSLDEHCPGVPVYVADDGEVPSAHVCDGRPAVRYLRMPFDSGLSAGRNFLVSTISEPYCVILDDDFVIQSPDTLPSMVSDLSRLGYDIIGGKLVREGGVPQHYEGLMWLDGRTLVMARMHAEAETVPMHIVLNFLAARTDTLRKVPWDDELKVCEHEDFFWRCKGEGVRVGYCPRAVALHQHGTATARYCSFRNRVGEMRAKALAKNGWERTRWVTM